MESPEFREVPQDPERKEHLRLRSEYTIHEILRENPNSRLRELVRNGSLSYEDAHAVMREANIDEKTGIDNAKFLKPNLNYEMAQSREKSERPLSVLVMDIDDFKQINTELGHVEADEILRDVAKTMQSSIRVNDDVREHDADQAVRRWGGEEFVAVLPFANTAQAREVAERIREKIETQLADRRPNGQPITVTIGVAEYDRQRHGDAQRDEEWKVKKEKLSWQRFIDDADQAMMAGKQVEKNRIYPEAEAA